MADGTPIEKFRRLHASVVAGTTAKPDAKLEAYLENVRHRAAAITEEDVADLLAVGHSQDAVFEATAGAALGAALERFEAGLRALEEAQKK